VDIDVNEPRPDDGAMLRRRLLGIGLGGAAVSLLPLFSGRAAATTPDTTPNSGPDTSAATTTSSPPQRPSDADAPLLAFSQGIELAIRDLYDVALGVKGWDDSTRAVLATIRESHESYATSLGAVLGRQGTQQRDAVYDDLRGSFGGDTASVLKAAYDLESTAVATHTDVLGRLQGTQGVALLASILIVEARHGTVLAELQDSSDLDELLVSTEADALTPAEG
jgi:hypothetical protein